MSIISNLKIGPRLGVAFASILVLLIVVASAAIVGINAVHSGLKTVYEDRTVCLGQLSQVHQLMLRNRILVTEMLDNLTPEVFAQRNVALQENIATITKTWEAYTATYMTPEEKVLADAFIADRKQYVKESLLPIRDAVLSGNTEEAQRIYTQRLPVLAKDAEESIDKLVKLQIDVAAQEYAKANATKTQVLTVKSRLVINALLEQFRFFGVPVFQGLNR